MATEAPNLITIVVKPATSYLPGTVGWTQQQLRQLELSLGVTRSGKPAIFCSNHSQGDRKTALAIFARADEHEEYENYHKFSTNYDVDKIYALAPEESEGCNGLFDHLTGPAYNLVAEFIKESVKTLRQALDHDDEVQELAFRIEVDATPTAD